MINVGDIFSISYGDKKYHSKEFLKHMPGSTPLIASGGRNNGIYGRFNIPATKKHIITVASTGSAGATFYHGYECEVSDDALVLTPKVELTSEQMLWITYMLRLNQHRFSYGRKVTPERLAIVEIPEPSSKLYNNIAIPLSQVADEIAKEFEQLDVKEEKSIEIEKYNELLKVEDIFDIEYGNSYELCNLKLDDKGVNFVSRTTRNNGISARVAVTDILPYPPGYLTVALGGQGGVLETCVQFGSFYTGRDVAVLKPKTSMSLEEKLFYCIAIKAHKFRYSFGRQANRTLAKLQVPKPPSWIREGAVKSVKLEIAVEIRTLFPEKGTVK